MDNNEINSILAELVALQPYYNVATSNNNQPWNSPVWGVRDDDFNLYWSSYVHATHSDNITANPNVFLTLYDSTRERGTNNFRCLYLQCTAQEVVERSEMSNAIALLYPGEIIESEEFSGDGLKRIYKAVPNRAWLNCLSERQLTPATLKMRTEISLERLRGCGIESTSGA